METLDFKSFLSGLHPFDALSPKEFDRVLKAIDILYFRENETIIEARNSTPYYYIIAKGTVIEKSGEELVTRYFAKDSFDAPTLIEGTSENCFQAAEESILFAMKRELFLELLKTNPAFESYYLQDIDQKLKSLVNKNSSREVSSFLIRRVSESFLHEVISVDASATIMEAVAVMNDRNLDALIVDFADGSRGIVTDKDLRRKVLVTGKPLTDPIGDIATTSLITIEQEDFLFNALLLMTEHSIKRVVVTDQGKMSGILEQVDIISLFSHRSTLITMRIEKAESLEELKACSGEMIYVIRSLMEKGVKVRHITKLLGELNHKLFAKTFALIAPPELIQNCCLIVLGSEGRKEQVLKTDQDNALILRDGFEHPEIETVTKRFTQALLDFGYPECPGKVMVSSPEWCRTQSAFKERIFAWCHDYSEANLMNLAIFVDAAYVTGDAALLDELKASLVARIKDDQGFFANFAKPVLMFETPLSFLSNFVTEKSKHKGELDLKKGAIFPLVHGVRALALEKGIEGSSTVERIKALNNRGVISREFAGELIESFNFLLTLRVNFQLEKLEQGREIDNYINPEKLTKLDRDLLRDVLKVVADFKKFVSHHFRLGHVV